MKNQQKIKVLLSGTDMANVVEWTKKMQSARVTMKLKLWNGLN